MFQDIRNDAALRGTLKVGEKVFLFSAGFPLVGLVELLGENFVKLNPATILTGNLRPTESLSTGEIDGAEPIPGGMVLSLGTIMMVTKWEHAVPLVKCKPERRLDLDDLG